MPDEVLNETENLETDDQTIETEDTSTKETSEKVVETPEKKREGILSRIGDIISGKKEKDEEEFQVPEDFAKAWDIAADKNEWTQKDLEELRDNHTDEELLEMIPFLSSETEEADESDDSSANEEDTQKEGNKEADEKLKAYEERIAALEEALAEGKERTQKEEAKNLWDRVSESFDKSGVESFGKTEQLPRFPDGRIIPSSPQYKARQEVWDIADTLRQAGRSLDESMTIALAAYKGKNLETDVKRDVIKDLKSKEQKLSAKRSSHGPTKVKHKYGPDVVGEVLRKHGLDEN